MKSIFALLIVPCILVAQNPVETLNHSLNATIRPTFTIGPEFYIIDEPYERPLAGSLGFSLGYSFAAVATSIIVIIAVDVNSVSFPDGDEYSLGYEWDENMNLIPVHEHWLQSERQVSYQSITSSLGFPFSDSSPFLIYLTLGGARFRKSYHSEYAELAIVGEDAEDYMWRFEPPEYYDGNGYWDVRNLALAYGVGCSLILKNHLVASLDFRAFIGQEKNEPPSPRLHYSGTWPEYVYKEYGFLFSLGLTYHLPLPSTKSE